MHRIAERGVMPGQAAQLTTTAAFMNG